MLPVNFDTHWGLDVKTYLSSIRSIGFRKVLEIPFEAKGVGEKFYVFFLKHHSVLLTFDTYTYKKSIVNTARIYYNWSQLIEPKELWFHGHIYTNKKYSKSYPTYFDDNWKPISEDEIPYKEGKTFEEQDDIFYKFVESKGGRCITIADDDARTGLRDKFNQLTINGLFIKRWVAQPFMWLVHHGDDLEFQDGTALTETRLQMLPTYVKKQILNANI